MGVLTVPFHLHGLDSLKAKRSIVKSVVQRLRNRFNVSVSEVAAHDSKRLAVIGIAVVSNEARFVEEQLDKIIDFIQQDGRFYPGKIRREIFPVNHTDELFNFDLF